MNKCRCTNSKTGGPKDSYATRDQAVPSLNASRKNYSDGDSLTIYYCDEGQCFHIGNSRERLGTKRVPVQRLLNDRDSRIQPPHFDPPPEWLRDTNQAPMPLRRTASPSPVRPQPHTLSIQSPSPVAPMKSKEQRGNRPSETADAVNKGIESWSAKDVVAVAGIVVVGIPVGIAIVATKAVRYGLRHLFKKLTPGE